MAQEEKTNDVRQSERSGGGRILWICAISTGVAILLVIAAQSWMLSTPAEESRGDIPQVESPNTVGEGLPPVDGADGG